MMIADTPEDALEVVHLTISKFVQRHVQAPAGTVIHIAVYVWFLKPIGYVWRSKN